MDSKTEPASEAKELKFQRLKNSLSALRLELPPEIIDDVIDNAVPYVIELREEITRLKAELERERELRKELVDALKEIKSYAPDFPEYPNSLSAFDMGLKATTKRVQLLIEKAKN